MTGAPIAQEAVEPAPTSADTPEVGRPSPARHQHIQGSPLISPSLQKPSQEPIPPRPSPFEPQLPTRHSPSIAHIRRIPHPSAPLAARPAHPRIMSYSDQSDSYTDAYRHSAFLPALRVPGRPRPNVRRPVLPGMEEELTGRAILTSGYSRGATGERAPWHEESDEDDVDGEGVPFGEM